MNKYNLSEGYEDLLILAIIFGLPIFLTHNLFGTFRHKIAATILIVNIGLASYFFSREISNFNTQVMGLNEFLEEGKSARAIIIRPFENLTGYDSAEFIVNGIHDFVQTALGQLDEFEVLRIDPQAEIDKLAAQFLYAPQKQEVDCFLEASVLSNQDSIFLNARLISARTNKLIWTQPFALPITSFHKLYRDIANEVGKQLVYSFQPKIDKSPMVEKNVLMSYLQGFSYLDKTTEQSMRLALRHFEKTVEMDPDHAPSHAGIGLTWLYLAQMNHANHEDFIEKGQPHIDKAWHLDSTDFFVQYIAGTAKGWRNWSWEKSIEYYERALEQNPNFDRCLIGFSHILTVNKFHDRAIEVAEKAVRIDPLNERYRAFYGMVLSNARQYDKVVDMVTDSSGNLVQHPLTPTLLRTTYHMLENYPKAIEMWLLSLQNDQEAHDLLKSKYESEGYSEALVSLAELYIERKAKGIKGMTAYRISTALLRGSEYERCLDWLEIALKEHDGNMPYINSEPLWDPIRDIPRFQAILKEIHLVK